MVTVRSIHKTKRERGAITAESIRLEFDTEGDTIEVGAFHADSRVIGGKNRPSTLYAIVLRSGQHSFITHLKELEGKGLSSEMLLTGEFTRLNQVLQELGWQQEGDSKENEDNHGMGNITSETIFTFVPASDDTDTTPQLPPILIEEFSRGAEAANNTILEIEKQQALSWDRITLTHTANWDIQTTHFARESLDANGYAADGVSDTFYPSSQQLGLTMMEDDTAIYTDLIYKTRIIKEAPGFAPTSDTAFLFTEARDAWLERLQSYGYEITETNQSEQSGSAMELDPNTGMMNMVQVLTYITEYQMKRSG